MKDTSRINSVFLINLKPHNLNQIMKKIYQLLACCTLAVSIISCSKEEKIKIDQLEGEWLVYSGKLVEDDSRVSYTFKDDSLCIIQTKHAISSGDTILNRTYQLSNDKKLITLFNENKIYTEQYKILKLTTTEMEWINASPKDGNTDKKLTKKR